MQFSIISHYPDTGVPARVTEDEGTEMFAPTDDFLANVVLELIYALYPITGASAPYDPINQ